MSVLVWGEWTQWREEGASCEGGRRRRERECGRRVEGAEAYCELCKLGAVEMQAQNYNCSIPSSISKEATIAIATLVAMVIVAVTSVCLGSLFFCLCWRECHWKRGYILR